MQPSSLSISGEAASASDAAADTPETESARPFGPALAGAEGKLRTRQADSSVAPLGGARHSVQLLSGGDESVRVLGDARPEAASDGKGGQSLESALQGLNAASDSQGNSSEGQTKGSNASSKETGTVSTGTPSAAAGGGAEESKGGKQTKGAKGDPGSTANSKRTSSGEGNPSSGPSSSRKKGQQKIPQEKMSGPEKTAQNGAPSNGEKASGAKGRTAGKETGRNQSGAGQGKSGTAATAADGPESSTKTRASSDGNAPTRPNARRTSGSRGTSGGGSPQSPGEAKSKKGPTRAVKPKMSDSTAGEKTQRSVKDTNGEQKSAAQTNSTGKGKASKEARHRPLRRAATLKGRTLQQGITDVEITRAKGEGTPNAKSQNAGSQATARQADHRTASSSGEPALSRSQESASRAARPSADESTKRVLPSDGGSSEKQSQKGSAKHRVKNGSSVQSKTNTGSSGGQTTRNGGQQSEGQSKQNRSGQRTGAKGGEAGPSRSGSTASSSRGGQRGSLGRSASPSDLFPGSGAERGGNGWTSSLSDIGGGRASSGKGARAGSAAGPPRTLPTAWVKTAAQGPMNTSELASGWKAMELTLGDEDGTVTVQTRSDPDRMNVSVRFSEARLQAQVAANARQLQDAMQAQYGSNVDLSFAGEGGDESGERAPNGSPSEDRPSTSASNESAEEGGTEDTVHKRLPNGGREWIG